MTNVPALIKIPAIYVATCFNTCFNKTKLFSSRDRSINEQANQIIGKNHPSDNRLSQMIHPKSIQPLDSKVLRPYTGDLTPLQKSNLAASFIDDNTLKIVFNQQPTLDFTIRRQNIFISGAKVIVNAANSHLGGGGGIDGAIHREGGAEYAKAHGELQSLYNSHYVLGYAAMIRSGLLKTKYHIDNVIVVAGPQGETSVQKENELYSCYYNSLILAHDQKKASLAIPSISTGIFGFSKERAASISLKAVFDFIHQYPNTTLKSLSIHFLLSDPKSNLEIYKTVSN